ncbi:ABC transporter ATP-binding protein [Rugosimonospora acidiphila]|uniref:ABC transporter ATP-binding protein n=1 Tax=Rugosimonospora acidiphila TaxID=556531 RepID=A0ABP9RV17_9ACTN
MTQAELGGATRLAAPPAIQIAGVTVHYGRTPALVDFSLDVAAGETVALLGPSGSGKSTALKAVAGFVQPSSGRILLGGRDVTHEPPHGRGVGVVVQQYALFPHLTVAENVAFGLRARRRPRAEVSVRVRELLDMVGMAGFAGRRPRELSGGQQQRVAIARALAIRPNVLLLDEPLSALDAALRADMLAELQRLRDELPDVAILYVTHDQGEALALAGRIAVMRDARLVDVDDAQRLYRLPPSRFTASFLGGANLLPATVLDGSDGDALIGVRIGTSTLRAEATARFSAGQRVLVCLRPHTLSVREPTAAGLPATLTGVQWRGSSYRLTCLVDEPAMDVHVDVPNVDGLPAPGQRVVIAVPEVGASVVPDRDEP